MTEESTYLTKRVWELKDRIRALERQLEEVRAENRLLLDILLRSMTASNGARDE